MNWVEKCRELGLDSRIVPCVIEIYIHRVQGIAGESLKEFDRLNQNEESGIEKWIKLVSGRDYEGDEVLLELLVEMYKKLERIEEKLFTGGEGLSYPLKEVVETHHIGHQVLCFEQELQEGGIYYGRIKLPIFPSKVIPFYMQMLSPTIAKIIKMGSSHTKSYDSYVAECERIEIRQKREGEK